MIRIHLNGPYARERAKRVIDNAKDGFLVEVRPRTRTDEQNDRLSAKVPILLVNLDDFLFGRCRSVNDVEDFHHFLRQPVPDRC